MSTDSGLLPPATSVGRVALSVRSIEPVAAFYRDVVGLEELSRDDQQAELGADGEPLVRLIAAPDTPPRGRDEAGLFHTAVLFPTRRDLAAALRRVESNWNLDGASDHRVSEALYLSDHAGNGVELYRDRPRDDWPVGKDGSVRMTTEPLDLDDLRAETDDEQASTLAPPGTRIGHVHLEVSSLDASKAFYGDALGLSLRQAYGDRALFLAAGDYHHHVGLNVWQGRSEPATGRGLEWFELLVPDEDALESVRRRVDERDHDVDNLREGFAVSDPDGIDVRLRVSD